MAVDVIRLVQGDERPIIILTLTDDISQSPIDLSNSGTVVSVKFRQAGTTEVPALIPCSILSPATAGKVSFNFTGGVLNVPPGMYEGEVIIDFNGQTETVYETLRFRVRENFGDVPRTLTQVLADGVNPGDSLASELTEG
jgi:hypothetical protein